VSGAVIAAALLVIADSVGREVTFLASLYSFGALIAFTAAQLAVIRLRFKEPDLARPYHVPVNLRIRGVPVPLAPLIGAPLTFALWIAALYTHDAARIAGPIWPATSGCSSTWSPRSPISFPRKRGSTSGSSSRSSSA
jgi:APA family basic amino acid/polyamine antiporter